MRLTTKYYLTFIFLCVRFLTNAQNNVFAEADKLYAKQKYFEAAIECERIIYNSNNNETIANSLLRKAVCYKQMLQFDKASQTLDRVNFFMLPDSLHFQIRYENALNSYLYGSFEYAEHQLKQLQYFIHDTNLTNKAILLNVLIQNELKNWDKAKDLSIKHIKYHVPDNTVRDSLIRLITDIYNKKSQPKIKSPQKGKILSTFLPGLGQIYAGYPAEGIFNTSLHLIFIGVAGVSVYYKYYLTGYFGGLGLLQKFYYGGIKRTDFLVRKKNHLKIRKYNDNIKNILTNI